VLTADSDARLMEKRPQRVKEAGIELEEFPSPPKEAPIYVSIHGDTPKLDRALGRQSGR
jgi:hypothetical protein